MFIVFFINIFMIYKLLSSELSIELITFQLVNHGISDSVFEGVFKGISDFFNPTEIESRKQYEKKNPTDRIRWGLRSSPGENREYLKIIAHPQYHCPTKPSGFRYMI